MSHFHVVVASSRRGRLCSAVAGSHHYDSLLLERTLADSREGVCQFSLALADAHAFEIADFELPGFAVFVGEIGIG